MKSLLKILSLIFLLSLVAPTSYAQSAKSFYDQGVSLLTQGKKNRNVATLNSAISQFNRAKALGTNNAQLQKNCSSKIQECQTLIKSYSAPTASKKVNNNTHTQSSSTYTDVVPTLVLSTHNIEFEAETVSEKAPTVTVKASPMPSTWTYSIANEADTVWCGVTRTDSVTLEFQLKTQNTSTRTRKMSVVVKHGSETATIGVTQKGIDFNLSVDPETIIFNKKGNLSSQSSFFKRTVNSVKKLAKDQDGQTVKVTCTSNQYYDNNKDSYIANWYIQQPLPEWLAATRTEPDNQNRAQAVKIKVLQNTSGKERKGEIIIKSQDKEVTITVFQEGGK